MRIIIRFIEQLQRKTMKYKETLLFIYLELSFILKFCQISQIISLFLLKPELQSLFVSENLCQIGFLKTFVTFYT